MSATPTPSAAAAARARAATTRYVATRSEDIQRSMTSVLADIRTVRPFSKSEKPASKVLLVRSPIDETTEKERARRVSSENWWNQHYFFNSEKGKRLLELNYSVLSDVRRAYNKRDVAEALLNEQMERIAKNSMTRVFDEMEKNFRASKVTKEMELERQRRLNPEKWLQDAYYFSSPEGQRAVTTHNDVLIDVRRVHNIREAAAAMDLEQAQRHSKNILNLVLDDMLRNFFLQKGIDSTSTEQGVRDTRNKMSKILEQLLYNARAKEISREVEEERSRLIEEGPATRFVRYNHTICQPFLPEIRRKRSFVEVC